MDGRQNPFGVKQYLTRLVLEGGRRAYDILVSGAPGYLVFIPIQGHINGIGGWSLTSEWWSIVRRKDLKQEISRLIPYP